MVDCPARHEALRGRARRAKVTTVTDVRAIAEGASGGGSV
jgi:hypothetical protein